MNELNAAEMMKFGGTGVMATADRHGKVNTAVYAIPHFVDEETVAWGITDGRTYDNLRENPHASFLYRNPETGYSGVRLRLVLQSIEHEGEMLETIQASTMVEAGSVAAASIEHVAYFSIVEVRPLV